MTVFELLAQTAHSIRFTVLIGSTSAEVDVKLTSGKLIRLVQYLNFILKLETESNSTFSCVFLNLVITYAMYFISFFH